MSRQLEPYQQIERSIQKTYHKRLWTPFITAVKQYDLIAPGDRIAACISGGKDSMLMAKLLQLLQRHSDVPFEVVYLVMDPGYNAANRQKIEYNAALLHIPVTIFSTDIFEITSTAGQSPCYLCARMRRGYLYSKARELGCNKIALGHHMDDIVGTLLLNLFYGGRMKAMPPILRSDDKRNVVIRPLAYVRESETEKFAKIRQYPLTSKGICGAGENLKRQEVKELIKAWDREFPGRIYNLFMSLQRVSPSHLMDKRLYDFHNFVPLLPAASADEGEDE